ncbi:hypothetical protein [Desulfatirhabdium butyrativorans]|uniref:hypothetical protein n=1 Tax=Desulfatirhabdium butyrativorans TaxID=340467 RepID=UPI00040B6239|nr:hypothetical protein [Desulfatirhabdium butyrativorans]
MKSTAICKEYRFIATALILCWIVFAGNLFAADTPKNTGGWEMGGKYDKYFRSGQRESFKGVVMGFKEIVPLPGMSPGIALLVKDASGDVITVHLGPKWFVTPGDTGIKRDDKVKVKGVWAEIDGKDVFMAAKISKGEFFEYKLRLTRDGTPFWGLSPEELAKERSMKTN